jgi:nitrite reductase (NADH) small subunit/3-phenylpropionate/trans-cinnamate dioxygenase ferredoxin subunit
MVTGTQGTSKQMSERFWVANCSDIPEGQGRSFEVNQRMVAVFKVGGEYFAIDDACPHMGASLSVGELDGCVVTCPLHAWRFDVRNGNWCDNPRVATDSFPVIVEGDDLFVEMEE